MSGVNFRTIRLRLENLNKKQFISVCLTLIQIFIFSVATMLEYLSDKKMGVARYLIYKNQLFERQFFNAEQLYLYKLIVATGLVISLLVLFYSILRIQNSRITWSILIAVVVNTFLLLMMFKDGIQLKAFPFFLLALVIIVAIQYLRFILQIIKPFRG